MYTADLPKSFPHRMVMTHEEAVGAITWLLTRTDMDNGSSFAVTVDAKQGYWHVWLSEASQIYLADKPIVTSASLSMTSS